MRDRSFDDVFNDLEYRALKEEEKKVYDLLSKVVDKKKEYLELEKEYRARLKAIASSISEREDNLKTYPKDADEAQRELKKSLKDVNEHIKNLNMELDLNRLRRSIGEYGEEEFAKTRDELQKKIIEEKRDREWIQDGLALLRRIKSGSRKIPAPEAEKEAKAPVAEKPQGETKKEATPAKKEKFATTTAPIMRLRDLDKKADPNLTIMAEMTQPIMPTGDDFDSDKTMAIPTDLIGSDPDRLLEPALHIHREHGWERFPLREEDISIGNIREPENDIALHDVQVSRKHAKIIYDGPTNCWFFVDLGSRNGSFLNNKFVESNDPQLLKNGDKVILGETTIAIYLPK